MQSMEKKLKERKAGIAVIGLGYVGLPLAVEQSKAGFTVIGIERKKERVDMVNQGKNYIPDVVDSELEKMVKEGKLRATEHFKAVSEADVI